MNESSQTFYILEEGDTYLENKWYADLLKKISQTTQDKIEILNFDLSKTSVQETVASLKTYSMFSSTRLIKVHQQKDFKEDDEELFLEYVKSQTPSTWVIWKMKKFDRRKKFFKKIQSLNMLMAFPTPKIQDMMLWLDKMLKEHDVEMDRQAKSLLIESIGPQLQSMDSEIQRLVLFIHPEKKITTTHVQQLILKSHGEDVFAFTDMVVQKNKSKALSTLKYLLNEGTVPLMITSLLARHYRILLKINEAINLRLPVNQMASYAGVPPFVANRYVDQSKMLKKEHCEKSLEKIQKIDREFKSTGINQRFLLEALLISLTK